jgi:flagellar motor switch protein FliN
MQPDNETLGAATVNDKSAPPDSQATGNLDRVLRIPVTLKVLLGSASMPIVQLTKLGRGAVIPLDRRVGEPVDVMINGRIIARGEIVVLDEEGSRFGVTLTEMIDNAQPQV